MECNGFKVQEDVAKPFRKNQRQQTHSVIVTGPTQEDRLSWSLGRLALASV